MRVPSPDAVSCAKAAASTERLRVKTFVAETAADAEPSTSLSLIAEPSAVTCREATADILAMNAATAETEAAPVTLASVNCMRVP